MRAQRTDEGFTLLELMIVMWIVGAIVGISLLAWSTHTRGEAFRAVSASVNNVGKILITGVKNNGTVTYNGSTVIVSIPNQQPLTATTTANTQLRILPSNGTLPTNGTSITDIPLDNADWCVSAPNPRAGGRNVQYNNKAAYLNEETTSCY